MTGNSRINSGTILLLINVLTNVFGTPSYNNLMTFMFLFVVSLGVIEAGFLEIRRKNKGKRKKKYG